MISKSSLGSKISLVFQTKPILLLAYLRAQKFCCLVLWSFLLMVSIPIGSACLTHCQYDLSTTPSPQKLCCSISDHKAPACHYFNIWNLAYMPKFIISFLKLHVQTYDNLATQSFKVYSPGRDHSFLFESNLMPMNVIHLMGPSVFFFCQRHSAHFGSFPKCTQ